MPNHVTSAAAPVTWRELLDPRSAHARSQRTTLTDEAPSAYAVRPTRIATGGPGRRLLHQQAASLLVHHSGALLVACRWDESGDREGDASNEQALYVSDDDGTTWRMANEGQPIITLAHGTSFDRPSSITHSFPWSDLAGRTWLYYTVNQPFTWGPGQPNRSTGGGEIRRVQLQVDGDMWRGAAGSEVVWAFCRPITDGAGGTWTDVRLLCLNGILRLRSGRCLMPVAGRSTVPDPAGAFWRLDRCWVLASDDDGATWFGLGFIGGGEALCLCEPTLFETARKGHVVALMRVQYDTGTELYRSDSYDDGATWTAPHAIGLPNTGGSGAKPYALALRDGAYALLQTNEHLVTDRTNVSLFLTDDASLKCDRWPIVKVLASECVGHWLGSAYGWLAEVPSGALHAVWVSYLGSENHLNHARLEPSWVGGTVVEPLAPNDGHGNDLPHPAGAGGGLVFPNTRSRAHLPRVGLLGPSGFRLRATYRVERAPKYAAFHLLELRTRNGRSLACRVALGQDGTGTVWLSTNVGWHDTGQACSSDARIALDVEVIDDRRLLIAVNGVPTAGQLYLKTVDPVSTVYLGNNVAHPEACEVVLEQVALAALTGRDEAPA